MCDELSFFFARKLSVDDDCDDGDQAHGKGMTERVMRSKIPE